MTLVPFQPAPGINSDDTTFSAQGSWADGSNVRFWEGKAQVIGGWKGQTSSAMTGTPRNLFAYLSGTNVLICGNAAKLYDVSLGTPADITPAALASGDRGWTFGSWGTYLMASPINDTLYVWTGTGIATKVTQAPASIGAGILVTPQRQVLAFACNEEISGTASHRCIRGSDLEDYTNWTTSATNNAFEHILDDPGWIIGARMIGEYVAVWTTLSLFIGTFVGDPGQAYRFDRVDSGCGLGGAFTITVASGVAYWMTPDMRWMTWTPGAMPVEIPSAIGIEFRTNCLPTLDKARMFYNRAYREVWLFYNDTRDGGSENTRYVAYSTNGQGWFKGILARSAAIDTGGVFSDNTSRPPASVYAADISTALVYAHEHASGSSFDPTWYIQSADQYLNEGGRRVMIRGVRTDFKYQTGGSSINLTLFTKNYPQSTAVTKGPYVLTSTTTKKDFRASGKMIAVKFAGVASNNKNMRFGKIEFDTVPMGER